MQVAAAFYLLLQVLLLALIYHLHTKPVAGTISYIDPVFRWSRQTKLKSVSFDIVSQNVPFKS